MYAVELVVVVVTAVEDFPQCLRYCFASPTCWTMKFAVRTVNP